MFNTTCLYSGWFPSVASTTAFRWTHLEPRILRPKGSSDRKTSLDYDSTHAGLLVPQVLSRCTARHDTIVVAHAEAIVETMSIAAERRGGLEI